MALNLATPVLKVPALIWVSTCLFFWIAALTLPPPEELEPPDELEVIFRAPVLVAKRKDAFAFELVDQKTKVKPVWYVMPSLREQEENPVQWQFGWDGRRFNLGFYRRHSKWTYTLVLYDYPKAKNPPLELSAENMKSIRPLLVEELNRRFPKEEAGKKFDNLLDSGMEETSYLCPQNGVMIVAWLLLLPTVFAVKEMFSAAESSAGAP
jgi:hypothetical protein